MCVNFTNVSWGKICNQIFFIPNMFFTILTLSSNFYNIKNSLIISRKASAVIKCNI